jgi:hypothetical protein
MTTGEVIDKNHQEHDQAAQGVNGRNPGRANVGNCRCQLSLS